MPRDNSERRWLLVASFCLLGFLVAVALPYGAAADEEAEAAADAKAESSDSEDSKSEEDSGGAAEDEDSEQQAADERRQKRREALEKAIHEIERAPLKVDVELKGTFESSQMSEIALRPEVWTEWVVVEAVEQGTRVEPGDTLVQFESRKLDEAIRDLETDRELARLSIEQARQDLEALEKTAPLELEMARRSTQETVEDLRYWESTERELAERMADYMLKSSQLSYENALEELNQLEQMYEADDLTEETEEIILKRQRAQVEFSKFFLERAKLNHERMLETEIPRRDESTKQGTRHQELMLEKAETAHPMVLARKRLELQKLEYERAKSDKRLERLQHDQKLMTIVAEQAGIVYYGRCTRGTWSNASSMAERLRLGGTISPNDPFMTLVQPRPLFVRAKVPEKELRHVQPNLQGKVTPEGYSNLKITAAVSSVSAIPVSEGNFEARINVDLGPDAEAIMPGMTCTVHLTPYVEPKALVAPTAAVFTDALDASQRYVWLVVDEVNPERRDVTVGETSGDSIEILSGLAEGDEILTKEPDDLSLPE